MTKGRRQGGVDGGVGPCSVRYLGDEQQVILGLREAVVDNDAQVVLIVNHFLRCRQRCNPNASIDPNHSGQRKGASRLKQVTPEQRV